MSFDKCIMTCIFPYSTIQNSFTALNIPSAPPIHPYIPPYPLATNDLFTVPIVCSTGIFKSYVTGELTETLKIHCHASSHLASQVSRIKYVLNLLS